MNRYVVAVKIYYAIDGKTPTADLKMNDGVVETIQWDIPKYRNEFIFNGYTLWYDTRTIKSWEEL